MTVSGYHQVEMNALTFAKRARIRPKAGYLLVPVTAESDARLQRLDSVSASPAPIDVGANVHPAHRALLQR